MSETIMNCADCDGLLLEWLEGDLDSPKRDVVDEHVASCARCHGLVRDVQGIRESAAGMPDLVPGRDLWSGIEQRIQPSVISIGRPWRSAAIPRYVLGAAAAALVAVSSGITYVATSRTLPRAAVQAGTGLPVRVAGATVEAPLEAPLVESAPGPEVPSVRGDVRSSSPREPMAARRPATTLASRSPAPRLAPAEVALSSEISELQDLLKARRGDLEPETVRVVEENLAIIDAAVSQARAAVARDPASGFLNERLESALQKKVQLLRTVALIRSST